MAKLRRGRRIGGYGDTKPIPLPPGYTIYPSHLTYTRDMPGRSPRATGSRYSTVEPRTVTQPLHAPRVTKYAPWDIKHAHMRGETERTLNEHRGITYQHVKGTSPWPKSMIPPRGAVSTPPEYLGVKDPRNVFGSGDPSALTAIGSIEDIPEGIRQTAMYLPQEALLRGREEVLKHVGAELREAVEAIPMVPFYGSSWGADRAMYGVTNVNPLQWQGTKHDWGEGLAEWRPGFMEGQPGEPVAAHARVQYDPFPSSAPAWPPLGDLGERGPYASHKDESQFDVAEHTGAHETMHVLHQLYPGTGLIWGDKNLEDRFLSGGNPDKGDLGVAQLILDPIINKHNAGELLSTYEQKVYEYVSQIIYTGGQDSTVIHELWAEIGSMGPDRIPQNLMWAYPFFQQQSEKNGNAP